MKIKTVLMVSVLVAMLSAATVLIPSADVSDASSQRWTASDCNGMTASYTDGSTYLTIELDNDPGAGAYKVFFDGKEYWVSGSDGKKVAINLGVALDNDRNYTVIATPNGAVYSCALSYLTYYTVTAVPSEGGTVIGGAEYVSGALVTLKATASDGYAFDGWYLGDKKVSENAEYRFNVDSDLTYTAKFVKIKYTVTVITSDKGTVTGDGTFDRGAEVKLIATPSEGYAFDGWYSGETKVSDKADYTFTITEDITLEAKWKVGQYTITFDTDGGSEINKITQDYGSTVTAPADPVKASDGVYDYTFDSWTLNGKVYIFSTMPSENITLKAQYTKAFSADTSSDANIKADDSGKTEIATDVVDYIKENNKTTIVKTDAAELKIPAEVFSNIVDKAVSDDRSIQLTLEKVDPSALNDRQKQVIGDAQVLSAEILIGNVQVHELGGKVTVTLPASDLDGISVSKAAVCYLKDDGNIERMESRVNSDGSISFDTDHFSYFFVKELTGSEGNSATVMIALVIVVALAVILLAFGITKRKAR